MFFKFTISLQQERALLLFPETERREVVEVMEDAGNVSNSEEQTEGSPQSSELGMERRKFNLRKLSGTFFRIISSPAEELHTNHHHPNGHHKQQPSYHQRYFIQKTSTRQQLFSCFARICRSLCCNLCDDIQCKFGDFRQN